MATYYLAVQGKVQENYDTLSEALKTLYSAREVDTMTLTFAESWKAEGIAIGKEEGKAEGKAEGKVDSMRLVLESRFGDVPAGILKKLLGVQDNRRLEKMIRLAATCQNLKDFQKAL